MDKNSDLHISGARAVVECLLREGVTTVFGYPGAAVLPLYDELRASGIRHVMTRTEQGAGHAASGYARMTGKPGVCIATSGPGATNLFTAVATAYGDSIPLVAITGQVATYQLGRDVFQEVDTTGAAQPFSKYGYLVKSTADIGRVFKEAFHIASTGRSGPVLVDIPVDIQNGLARFAYPDAVSIRGYKPRSEGNALQVKRVAEAIEKAKRPVLCLGGGVFLSGARDVARAFCERVRLPVVSTLMGIGALPPDHPRYYGMLGQSGGRTANGALAGADLLILIGARVGDRAIARPSELNGTTVVHVDIDSAEIGKNVGATIPLVGDASRVLSQLLERGVGGAWPEWLAELDASRAAERAAYECRAPRGGSVDPAHFCRELSGLLPGDAIYVADVGQNQIWSAKYYNGRGRFLTTGGMGTMGYSIPAAAGAQLACPESKVLAVCGDGSFQMSMNELATIRQYGLPVKIVVMRNDRLGLIGELQAKAGMQPFSIELGGCPDLGLVAAAYGIAYARADSLERAVSEARGMMETDGAFLLECTVGAEETT